MNRIRISVTYLYFTGLLLIFTVACTGTTTSDEIEKVFLLDELDKAPEFPGGYDEFINYLIQEIKASPAGTFDAIDDKIYIDFIIDSKGKISGVKVKNPLPLGTERALKSLLEKSPNWSPGKVNGEVVSSFQTLPLKF
jgi:protein TonB